MALSAVKKSRCVIAAQLIRCRYTHSTSSPNPHHTITNNLISIFTKYHRPDNIITDHPQLKTLAPHLTPKIVESVLEGLNSWRSASNFFTWASDQYCHGYTHNCYTYNKLASILSRARQNAQLRSLASHLANSQFSMPPGALGFFIRCLGSVGLCEDANFLFDLVRLAGRCVPNIYTYNCLLEALSKSPSSGHLVETRLNEMRELGFEFNKYTLTPLLQVYCNGGHFDKALDVFNEMCDRGWIDAHVLSILAVSFSKWGKVDEAMELIQTMEEDLRVCLNERTSCVLVHVFVKEGRVDRALQVFDKMRDSGFTLFASLFDVLISGLCRNEEVEKALSLYSEMMGLGIQPDIGLISKLVSSFPEEVLLQEFPQGMDPKALVLLYNSVLKRLVENGLIDKAYSVLQTMTRDGEVEKSNIIKEMIKPDTTSFGIVMDSLLGSGKLDMALCLFQDMVRIGFKPNVLLYNNLIDGLCSANRLRESHELLSKMKESGLGPTQFTHNSIFGCLCREGDVSSALDFVKVMRVYGHIPWIKHSTMLVKKLCKHGKVEEACNFLGCMVQEGFLPDIIPYSVAIDGLMKIEKVDQGLDLFNDICARGHCPDVITYNVLVGGLCKAKRNSEALDLLNHMAVKGLVPSVATYNLLIDCWCKDGDIDRAMACLSLMFEKHREPNVITYSTLIDGLCSSGRPDDALLLWKEMGEKGCTPNHIAFMALIHGLCNCDRPDAGLLYFREMDKKKMEPDTYVYVGLISSFLSCVKPPLALEVLKEMVDKGKFPDPLDKTYATVIDSIHKLLEDDRTSMDIRNLIAEGRIPSITTS